MIDLEKLRQHRGDSVFLEMVGMGPGIAMGHVGADKKMDASYRFVLMPKARLAHSTPSWAATTCPTNLPCTSR